MASWTCMNVACATSTSIQWRKGWALRSGEFADLCDKCGSAYEQSAFCDMFHSKDSGWRECTSCGKRLHCGCVASHNLLVLLDTGGISCTNCARNTGLQPILSIKKPDESGTSKIENVSELQCTSVANQLNISSAENLRSMQIGGYVENGGIRHWFRPYNVDTNGLSLQMKQEEVLPFNGELGRTFLSQFQDSNGSSKAIKGYNCKEEMEIRDIYESVAQTNLSMTLGTPLENSNPFSGTVVDEREHSKSSSPLPAGARSRHLLPKPPRSTLTTGLEANAGMVSQIRVARPPAEGRGRNQLLPRYWPRITDQELQQISGDSNSTIVPLFEKMLSASDAGRIGRLVLPKACAERYFPPISQPEGLPLRIQDVKGKEWLFQFRFWPNNNSRMYVLEGVTPCIQSMQLQAGDTVTFSRMDPEGKLIMGFRKATNSATIQESHPSNMPDGSHSSELSYSGVYENLPVLSGYSGLLQSLKGSSETHLNALSKKWNASSGDMNWQNPEMQEGRKREDLLQPPALLPERKRTRNIGSKSKRLLIDSLDALELKLTWEEAQDLLRPPPTVNPSIVTIEDHVFEEYEEPPIFGKRSIFVVCSTGIQEQWTQCDSCSKWRKLPVDVLLPPKWTCVDNAWDPSRCSCSAPDELTPRELDNLLRLNKEFKKQRMEVSHRLTLEHEYSGLDALANAAILGDGASDSGRAPVATTTKHPRHRPGCSCIVCIQPPSGKGKHKPTCTCNVCNTVKRRFKTLMMRKKKRQSEREAEIAQRNQQQCGPRDESEVDSASRHLTPVDGSENEARASNELDLKSQTHEAESAKGQLDLNCHPEREDMQAGSNSASMMGLLKEASLPLETYLRQNGLSSLISEQQANSASNFQEQTTNENESEGRQNEDCCPASTVQGQESSSEANSEQDQIQNNPSS